MTFEEIFILNIPFQQAPEKKADELEQILVALDEKYVGQLSWGIADLWWLGEEDLRPLDLDAQTGKTLISGESLLEIVKQVTQTLKGLFVGYLNEENATEFLGKDWKKSNFITSPADVMVEVVEDAGFDVYVKNKTYANRLVQAFQDTRWEEPADFFLWNKS